MDLTKDGFYRLTSERASTKSIAQRLKGRWYLINEFGAVTLEEIERRGWRVDSPIDEMIIDDQEERQSPPRKSSTDEWMNFDVSNWEERQSLGAASSAFDAAWESLLAAENALSEAIRPDLEACKTMEDYYELIDRLPKRYRGVRSIYETIDRIAEMKNSQLG